MQTEINFHNTVHIQGTEQEKADCKAYTQDQLVLNFFRNNADQEFTPAEVYKSMLQQKTINELTPITSIRRAICNLTTACYLVKQQTKRPGMYGMVNFTWKLNKEAIN